MTQAAFDAHGVYLLKQTPLGKLGGLDDLKGAGMLLASDAVGAAACPECVMGVFAALDIELIAAWGITELSPVGGVGAMTPSLYLLPFEQQQLSRLRQGRPPCGSS
jgi:hypothetical protein